ncbi:MAG: hypothetical protein LUG89_03110, partial [Methanosphaera sp.]|nr:hypothetical protein [Methanosphaera sp.]
MISSLSIVSATDNSTDTTNNTLTCDSEYEDTVQITSNDNSSQSITNDTELVESKDVKTSGVYYVNSSATDNGDGSINNPWNSITQDIISNMTN